MPETLEGFGPVADIVSARGHTGQLYQYAALLAGAKPCLDDWISVERVRHFEIACRALGLFVVTDVVFAPVEAPGALAAMAPTTRARALLWGTSRTYPTGSQLHVFVARSEHAAVHAWSHGWYPLLVGEHLVGSPQEDAAHLGRALGYPDCCIQAFRSHDWNRCNGYEVAYQASLRFDPLCCPTGRNTDLSFIFHIPCQFACEATAEAAGILRRWMAKNVPFWLARIEAFHRNNVFAIWNEHRVYALRGRRQGSCVTYEAVAYLGSISSEDMYGRTLREHRTLELVRDIAWLTGSNGEDTPVLPCGYGPGPERPLLLDFNIKP